MLRGSARTGKAGSISAMAIPLEGVPIRGQGIEDIERDYLLFDSVIYLFMKVNLV